MGAMDVREWLDGLRVYARSRLTPPRVVFAISAVVGAVSAVVAVAVFRDLTRGRPQTYVPSSEKDGKGAHDN